MDSSWNKHDGFKSTKSGDERIVPISTNLLPILEKLKNSITDSSFVLPRVDNWDRGEQARDLRMFIIGIGLQPIRFHDLRATWTTILLSKGVEPIVLMKMGGWKDIKTMMHYVRMTGIDTESSTDILNF